MLKFENLNFKFSDSSTIFDNCTFEVPDGSKTVLLGLNGTGKSTLFKIITKEIKLNSKFKNTFKNVFYLPQNAFCPKGVTAFDYLATVFFKNGFKWFLDSKEIDDINNILKRMEIYHKKDVYVENLSGGEFQKLNLALALLFETDLLLLDEPISSLDIINQKQVFDVIKNLKTTTITILHDLNFALGLGDNFIGITRNHKILQASKEKFFTNENLKDIFGIDFKVVKNNEKIYVQIAD